MSCSRLPVQDAVKKQQLRSDRTDLFFLMTSQKVKKYSCNCNERKRSFINLRSAVCVYVGVGVGGGGAVLLPVFYTLLDVLSANFPENFP